MIYTLAGKIPDVDPKAYVFEGAVVAGKVVLKEYSSVWFNVTVRGDKLIEIGRYTNIQDNSCIHAENYECKVGDYVTVGHGAILHCCEVQDHCLIGIGATVLDGAIIGRGSIVAAGALVTKDAKIPPNSLVAGVPAKVLKTLDEKTMLTRIHNQAVKYKTLWTQEYNLLPNCDGEVYDGGEIV